MESHKWEEVDGPNSGYDYYRCTICGVYIACVGEEIVSWSLKEFDIDVSLDIAMRLASYGEPSCSEVREVHMEEALG